MPVERGDGAYSVIGRGRLTAFAPKVPEGADAGAGEDHAGPQGCRLSVPRSKVGVSVAARERACSSRPSPAFRAEEDRRAG